MIARSEQSERIRALLRDFPVVAILGARQVGKTTLAREILRGFSGGGERFDLEDSTDLARLADAKLALSSLTGLVVIDEVQRRPDLFPTLRVLADRKPRRARFLVLGSASRELLHQASESLAGRIAFHTLDGFDLSEVGPAHLQRIWRRGGFPGSYLARSEAASFTWRSEFIRTFVERDLPQLGIGIPGPVVSRFWSMLAHVHGQRWNGSEIGRAFGVSDKTVRSYLDALGSALVVDQLQPWFANVGKRQVKAPKVYIRDSGLLHALLGIRDRRELEGHPKVGASWEGFLLRQVITHLDASPNECYFWATHAGPEIDLLWIRGRQRWGFEFKRTSAPTLTSSLRASIDLLALDRAFVLHAGDSTFPLAKNVQAIAADRLLDDLHRPS